MASDPQASAQSVIRLVPQADLRILDPVFNNASITRNFSDMIYDVLFAPDSSGRLHPQMVKDYATSPDGLVYTFTLRSGLKFHDGSPVQARDVVASIKRWGARITQGQLLMSRTQSIEVIAEDGFRITLKSPFGLVVESLSNLISPVYVMREKEATTDPFQQVTESIGSGPFKFLRSEWQPGNKAVFVRNSDYVPRSETPNGRAGAKIAKVERIEWIYIPDPNIATVALNSGEIDILETPALDYIPILERNPEIVVKIIDPVGYIGLIRPNHLVPPFNDLRARQALITLVDQKTYLSAIVGDERFQKPCYSPFICGTVFATDPAKDQFVRADKERAKKLLAEAGYRGEPIVIMDPTDQKVIHDMTLVTAQLLREIGVNVQVQAMDWGTLTTRRPIKEPPSSNPAGWHLFHTFGPGPSVANPIDNLYLASGCDGKNWFGWPCDESLEKLRLSFIDARTDSERANILETMRARFYDVLPYINLGMYRRPIAYRSSLSGILDNPELVLWNVEKR